MLPLARFPLITDEGQRLLHRLQEHPHAPRYTHLGYDRVTPTGVRETRTYADEIRNAPPCWRHGEVPAWLAEFVAHCYREVPVYRRHGPPPERFFDLPAVTRADLNREPWSFVPDTQPLDDLSLYNTSGTTGHPLDILTHADTLARYLPLLQAALATRGLSLDGGPDHIAVVLVCSQQRTYTYAAVSAVLDQAGFVKVNLNPGEWRDPDDRARFLDDCDPQVYTGDPLAFAELAQLPLRTRPRALVSTAMTLLPGLRRSLEARFDCPVMDLYSTNESGPIAAAEPEGEAYLLLQPRLYVEVLDPHGAPCPPGVRGEVTLSGGFNPFLPLLRYRTGDFAHLEFRDAVPVLAGLEGRPPIVFRAVDGRPVNNVDVSNALRHYPIAQFTLHQFADGALTFRMRASGAGEAQIRAALLALFGPSQPLIIEVADSLSDKVVQYTSDLSAERILHSDTHP